MATRFRKSRRQRGTRYCGWGQIGQHRQSGSRGGIGGAGKHKHFWIRTVIEEPDHFGHDTLNSYLGSLGIQKLLGGGNISESYVIKVAQASASAKKKIESAGGSIISNEHSAE